METSEKENTVNRPMKKEKTPPPTWTKWWEMLCSFSRMLLVGTLPETNVAPENGWLEDYFPVGEAYFQGLC